MRKDDTEPFETTNSKVTARYMSETQVVDSVRKRISDTDITVDGRAIEIQKVSPRRDVGSNDYRLGNTQRGSMVSSSILTSSNPEIDIIAKPRMTVVNEQKNIVTGFKADMTTATYLQEPSNDYPATNNKSFDRGFQ